MIVIYFWLACVLSALGGTVFWFRTARHRPNKDSERLGLVLLYLLLMLVTAMLGGILWVACRAIQGLNSH